ncbi:MAG: hypothetical protein ACRDZR_18555 [Acidimicrobiales bacterium]
MNGTKTEVRPGVWRLRVFAGRLANGTPIQKTKTVVTPEALKGKAKPGRARSMYPLCAIER